MSLRSAFRIRFGLREFLLTIAGIGIALALVLRWWTQPYALTGTHSNGVRAWEQWERRTLTMQIAHVETIRFYRNGRKGFEVAKGEANYWAPDGKPITQEEYWRYLVADGLKDVGDDQTRRPYESFLWWWNGW